MTRTLSCFKMEVDSEGVAIGASAEAGGPPTTPPKHKPAK